MVSQKVFAALLFLYFLLLILACLAIGTSVRADIPDGSPLKPYEFGVEIPLRDGLKLAVAYSSHLGSTKRLTPARLEQILPDGNLYITHAEPDTRSHELIYTAYVRPDDSTIFVAQGCLRVRRRDLLCVGDDVINFEEQDATIYRLMGFRRMPQRRSFFNAEQVTIAAINEKPGMYDEFVPADHLVRYKKAAEKTAAPKAPNSLGTKN